MCSLSYRRIETIFHLKKASVPLLETTWQPTSLLTFNLRFHIWEIFYIKFCLLANIHVSALKQNWFLYNILLYLFITKCRKIWPLHFRLINRIAYFRKKKQYSISPRMLSRSRTLGNCAPENLPLGKFHANFPAFATFSCRFSCWIINAYVKSKSSPPRPFGSDFLETVFLMFGVSL